MCSKPPKPSPPPPLPPPPPPPAPPVKPLPPPERVDQEQDINPQVRQAKSRRDRNPYATGTGALRIPLTPGVNTGGDAGSNTGGLNV
tara:strand:- start:138 stop:398 length:261 start_codon:yes stop_codon:yes gene_type:complete